MHDRGELAFFRVTVVKVAPLAIRLRSFDGVQWVKCAFWGGSHPQSSFEQIASMKGWELNTEEIYTKNIYTVFQFRFSQCSQSQVLRIAKLQLRILEPLCDYIDLRPSFVLQDSKALGISQHDICRALTEKTIGKDI